MSITKVKKITNRPLTRKQAAFVKHLVENPKSSATKAALSTYNTTDRTTASVIATENLAKPSIISELAKYNNLVENTLINTVQEWGKAEETGKRTLAIDTSKYIHDKIHGKATQRIEQHSTSVSLTLDLSQVVEQNP